MNEKHRRLGQSELWLSPLGLGAWQFSGGNGFGSRFWQGLSQEQVTAIIRESLSGGINWIDTAEAYGHGVSEQMIAAGLDEIEKHDTNSPFLNSLWK